MIEICYTFDNKYIQHVATSINSILKIHDKRDIKFHLVCNINSKQKIKVLTNWLCINNCNFELYNINPKILFDCPIKKNDRLTKIAYYRIFLSNTLPNDCKKVLYLDPDTIVLRNLKDLFNTDISTYALGAVCVFGKYFNSGVLLINLDFWRKYNIQNKLLEYIVSNKNKIECHDQDVLNEVLKNNFIKLPLKYNAGNNIFRVLKRSKLLVDEVMYSDEEIEDAKKYPSIIHFAGSFHYKPWYRNCIHCWQNLYIENLKETPYKNFKLKHNYLIDIMKEDDCPCLDLYNYVHSIIKCAFEERKFTIHNFIIKNMYKNKKLKKLLFNFLSRIFYYKITFFNKKEKEIYPTQVIIDISGMCNAKCPFCIRQLTNYQPQIFMKKEIFYRIMKEVKKIKSIKLISLSAYGEPLLHPNFDEFVNYLKKLKYNIHVTTNMTLAHEHFDTLLNLTHIMFSIEGWDKESYEKYRKNINFETVYNNIKQFDKLVKEKRKNREKVPSRAINFLLTKETKVKKFLNLWQPYSDLIHFGLMKHPMVWNDKTLQFDIQTISDINEEIIPLTNAIHSNNCSQLFNVISINPKGEIRLCCNDSNSAIQIGTYKNLKKSFFKNKFLNQVRKELTENKIYVCKNCSWNYDISLNYLKNYLPEISEINVNNNK